uniref:Uncharacterized protein n=1 Tax=Anguilla anguilla TaxID=7936 RepID=A0A0E9QZS3_ANGAN
MEKRCVGGRPSPQAIHCPALYN